MKSVLIIKLSALGDILLASRFLTAIIEYHSNEPLVLLTKPEYASLFSHFKQLQTQSLQHTDWPYIIRTGIGLRNRFNRVYDLQGSKRSRVLTWLSNAPQTIGLWPGWPYRMSGRLPVRPRVHPEQRLHSMLQAADINVSDYSVKFPVDQEAQTFVTHWLHQQNIFDQPLLLIHAGCSPRWLSKRWPEDNFFALARYFEQQGWQVIWLGGADDQALNQRLSQQTGIDASNVFSIFELIALAQYARCAITNDSGPMHALALSHIPVYALFGPTDWRLSHASGQAERVFNAAVSCSPCFQPKCPLNTEVHRCMTQIKVVDVIKRLHADGVFADTNSDTIVDTAARLTDD